MTLTTIIIETAGIFIIASAAMFIFGMLYGKQKNTPAYSKELAFDTPTYFKSAFPNSMTNDIYANVLKRFSPAPVTAPSWINNRSEAVLPEPKKTITSETKTVYKKVTQRMTVVNLI